MAGAPLENQNSVKYKTPEERKEICRQLIEHLESGLSWTCFAPLSHKTIQEYMIKYPIDFPPESIEAAFRKGSAKVEQLGWAGTMGKVQGFNPSSWKFIAMNRAGWKEKSDTKTAHTFVAPPTFGLAENIQEQ